MLQGFRLSTNSVANLVDRISFRKSDKSRRRSLSLPRKRIIWVQQRPWGPEWLHRLPRGKILSDHVRSLLRSSTRNEALRVWSPGDRSCLQTDQGGKHWVQQWLRLSTSNSSKLAVERGDNDLLRSELDNWNVCLWVDLYPAWGWWRRKVCEKKIMWSESWAVLQPRVWEKPSWVPEVQFGDSLAEAKMPWLRSPENGRAYRPVL